VAGQETSAHPSTSRKTRECSLVLLTFLYTRMKGNRNIKWAWKKRFLEGRSISCTLTDLKISDGSFCNVTRLTTSDFEVLLQMVGSSVAKNNIISRDSVDHDRSSTVHSSLVPRSVRSARKRNATMERSCVVDLYCRKPINRQPCTGCVTRIRLRRQATLKKNGVFWDVTPYGSCKNRRLEELNASFIRVTRIGKLGTTLALISSQRASAASYC
jgi:hypothetical protein